MARTDHGAVEPRMLGSYNSEGMGRWYAAGVPQGGEEKPVLVFVPGLGQFAQSWWDKDEFYGMNDMAALAAAAGYRTAFVSFMGPGMKPFDMWQNGRMLAWQIGEICRNFHVQRVTLVAHSKGGVDSEAAAVHAGAAAKIDRIITLSSPHWGSQLADIAYSSAGWHLGEHLGVHSDGCYVMQTGYMKEFRRLTDALPLNTAISTFGGHGSGPAFTTLWLGSLLMDRYGPNDGVVAAANAVHPRGQHLATLGLNHAQMHVGRFVWPYVQAAVEGKPVAVPAAASPLPCIDCGAVVRGGALAKGIDEELPVDSGVGGMTVSLTVTDAVAVRLIAPGKTVHTHFTTQKMLDGRRLVQLTLDRPQPGKWQLKAPKGKGAYLAYVRFYPAAGAPASAAEPAGRKIGHLKRRVRVTRTYPDHVEAVGEYELPEGAAPQGLPCGFYSLEENSDGELGDGSPYSRTAVRTLCVPPDGAGDEKAFLSGLGVSRSV